jgi:glutathione synthase/RimK-type ligase-like ATP-grasp enzyme
VILVISHEQDPHADRVIRHLRADGHDVLLFNLTELPDRATLTIDYDGSGRPRIDFTRRSGESFALNAVQSVWWRRPQVPNLASVTDPQVNMFAANEWHEAINGLWQLLLDARWMNDPTRDDAASRKARQLRVAAEVGLRTPRTVITSDPARAKAFIEQQGVGNTIYKTFSCTHAVWRETRLLQPEDLAQLEAVRVTPVIFQQFIPAESDLRITHVDGNLYVAAIRSAPGEGVDFRMSVGSAAMAAEALPTDIAERLRTLMRRLGLVYGAIDMRRTPAGEYYFFEVNTAGEFLFVEDRTSLPIARAIAAWLAGTPTPS